MLAMHYALVAYVNSSLLAGYLSPSLLNMFYALGSLLSVLALYLGPILFKKYGSVLVTLFYVALEIFAVFGMGSVTLGSFIIFLFLLHQSGESMLYFALDVHLEQETKKEGLTGSTRGIFLTVANIAWVTSPLLISFLVKGNDFSNAYLLSAATLVPLFILTATCFKNTSEVSAKNVNVFKMLKRLLNDGDEKRVIIGQFILQFFFSWMTIYLPLLLSINVGFEWKQIGLLFTIMLLPFLLFELPVGRLADKKWGEKELLYFGFAIMGIFTFFIPFMHHKIFWAWATILFMTRVGASIVEVASESYFFKQVKESDTALISLFRMTRPLSSIVAPIIAIPILTTFSYSGSFVFLALFTFLGLLVVPKVDTR